MKKIFMIMAAVAGMLAVASCQKEIASDQFPAGEEVAAVFSVDFPDEIATKAEYSDGTKATELHYAVYDGATGRFLFGTDAPLQMEADLTKEVTIKLVKNFAYDIVFWAQAPGAPYRFDKEAATLTVTDKYTNFANDDLRDAFYQVVNDYKVVPTPTDVRMFRPFAQINFGASDYREVVNLGLTMTSKVEIAGIPNVLNLLTRKVSGSVDASFTPSPVPAASGELLSVKDDKQTYGYVSMNYILAPEEDKVELSNVTGTFYYNNDNIAISVPNVPYRRNYRTNIIGQFFSGDAQFKIEIWPLYDDEYIKEY